MIVVMEPIEMEPQMNADERRLITSAHRKGRKDRKVQQNNRIRGYPRHPRNPCSIRFVVDWGIDNIDC